MKSISQSNAIRKSLSIGSNETKKSRKQFKEGGTRVLSNRRGTWSGLADCLVDSESHSNNNPFIRPTGHLLPLRGGEGTLRSVENPGP